VTQGWAGSCCKRSTTATTHCCRESSSSSPSPSWPPTCWRTSCTSCWTPVPARRHDRMAASTELGAAGAPGEVGPPEPAVVTKSWDRHVSLPRSPKIIFGLVTLGLFVVLAVIGPWIAPYSPGTSLSTTNGVPQPPSAAHWLGTTQVQQDVLSQLLVGGRPHMPA